MAQKTKISPILVKYLDKAGIKHNILEHRTAYTAMDVAATMKRKLEEIAKSLLIMADKDYYVVILPADHNLDFKKLGAFISKQTGKKIKVIKIPTESAMTKFLNLKSGAISAFGGLYKLPVIVEKKLGKTKKAVFSSGSFNHSVEIAVDDFIKFEKALLADFGVKRKLPKIVKVKAKVKKVKKSKK